MQNAMQDISSTQQDTPKMQQDAINATPLPYHETFTYSLTAIEEATPWIYETKKKYKCQDKIARRETTEQKAQELKGRIDAHLDDLYQSLQNGHSEKVQELLAYFANFHYYSTGNQILITLQNKNATIVAGYKTWEEKGRTVKKGEHGIAILAPMIGKKRAEAGSEDGDQTKTTNLQDNHTFTEQKTREDKKEPVLYGFKTVYVFDIAQTEGEPLPTLGNVKGDATEALQRLKQYAGDRGIIIEYVPKGAMGEANGYSQMGKIVLVEGREPADEFRTLAHEIGHEALHPDIPTRIFLPKKVKETEAEAVAFVICQAMGLDTSTISQDYILLHQGGVELLTASLERIREASSMILSGLEKTGTGKKTTADKKKTTPKVSPTPREEAKQETEEPKYETLTLDL
jgi:hypothetical protein